MKQVKIIGTRVQKEEKWEKGKDKIWTITYLHMKVVIS